MRSFLLISVIFAFIISLYLNCTLYGAIARIPYFGITFTEYAEKERDVFLVMYIAGGSLLPHNEKIKDLSMSLARRLHREAFAAPQQKEPIGPYATRSTFDLAAALVRILYWVPPVAVALFFILLLLPQGTSEEDDLS